MSKGKDQPTYAALNAKLEAVMAELQREDLDIDEALQQYQRGLELVQQLEAYLDGAEHRLQELKVAFNQTTE